LNFKYNIADKVYIVDYENYKAEIPCDTCCGEKNVEIKGEKFSCPDCNGRGHHLKDARGFRVKRSAALTVNGIYLENSSDVYYFVKEIPDVKIKECDIFNDFGSAKNECMKRNKEKKYTFTKYEPKSSKSTFGDRWWYNEV
jgi:RecJ-like exonuclease